MPTWSIGYPEQERIEIELLSPPADDCGYDWVSARVHAVVGAFRGTADMVLLGADMQRFRDVLEPVYRDLRGTAEFVTIEDQLRMKVVLDRLGHVQVSGYVKDDASFGNRLSFELGFDQTVLRRTLSELDDVIRQLRASKGQPCAAPNGGPATQLGNSGVTEGPPSVS